MAKEKIITVEELDVLYQDALDFQNSSRKGVKSKQEILSETKEILEEFERYDYIFLAFNKVEYVNNEEKPELLLEKYCNEQIEYLEEILEKYCYIEKISNSFWKIELKL